MESLFPRSVSGAYTRDIMFMYGADDKWWGGHTHSSSGISNARVTQYSTLYLIPYI